MTQPNPNVPTAECVIATIIGFLLPFFLAGAGGNQDIASAAIRQLIDAYNAGTPEELDLVGRIIGFSTVSMDNLRLSMIPGLSDTKVLQYRNNAVTLCRSSDNARKMLDALQAGREAKRTVPRPAVAPAPPAPKPAFVQTNPPVASPLIGAPTQFPADIDAMKRDARAMMAAFSRNGATGFAAPLTRDTANMVKAAARAAVASATRPATT